MDLISISFTLVSPGQNYNAIYDVIDLISAEYANVDQSQFLIRTPYSEAFVQHLLEAELDRNDTLLILGVSSVRTVNPQFVWKLGAQGSPTTRGEARRTVHYMRRAATLRVAALRQCRAA
jgi:hypothetical protein